MVGAPSGTNRHFFIQQFVTKDSILLFAKLKSFIIFSYEGKTYYLNVYTVYSGSSEIKTLIYDERCVRKREREMKEVFIVEKKSWRLQALIYIQKKAPLSRMLASDSIFSELIPLVKWCKQFCSTSWPRLICMNAYTNLTRPMSDIFVEYKQPDYYMDIYEHTYYTFNGPS